MILLDESVKNKTTNEKIIKDILMNLRLIKMLKMLPIAIAIAMPFVVEALIWSDVITDPTTMKSFNTINVGNLFVATIVCGYNRFTLQFVITYLTWLLGIIYNSYLTDSFMIAQATNFTTTYVFFIFLGLFFAFLAKGFLSSEWEIILKKTNEIKNKY